MQTQIDEVAPDIFRLSTFLADLQMQFNQFLVRDDEPLLFHTGPRALFPLVVDAVAKIIDAVKLRWISFSHFEADECGSLNEWLELAPHAEPACGLVGAMVSVNDYSKRPAHILQADDVLTTGTHTFRYLPTPQVPHAWDAGLLFDSTHRTLFCSDLFHQLGNVEAVTEDDVVDRFRATLVEFSQGPFGDYIPYTKKTQGIIESLADLDPSVILPMHGSASRGNGAGALRDMGEMLRDTIG
jgi:flavorubredoxin